MKRKFLFYWRVFFLFALLVLFLTKIISLETFLTVVAGIVVFVGIPAAVKFAWNKGRND